MSWVRIEDRYATHRKMLQAGPIAMAVDVAGMCYAAGHGTDGFIPAEALAAAAPFLTRARSLNAVGQLVTVGRWRVVPGGWQIHDFLTYNPSASEREAKRDAAAERTQRWRDRKRGGDTSPRRGARRGGDTSTASQRDTTLPGGLRKPEGKLSQTPPPDDASQPDASPDPDPSAASPSLVASGASSAADKPAGQQLSGNGARCRHGNDTTTCGVCSPAVGTPPPAAARAELDAVRARTRRGGDENPTGNEPKSSATSTGTLQETSAK